MNGLETRGAHRLLRIELMKQVTVYVIKIKYSNFKNSSVHGTLKLKVHKPVFQILVNKSKHRSNW